MTHHSNMCDRQVQYRKGRSPQTEASPFYSKHQRLGVYGASLALQSLPARGAVVCLMDTRVAAGIDLVWEQGAATGQGREGPEVPDHLHILAE
jgi:hypothetical protein